MKNLKVSDTIHQELKIFAAKKQYSMSVIASDAISIYLGKQGHKFVSVKSKTKLSDIKNAMK